MIFSIQIEFDRLLEKHMTETGLPVVVDFYSDSCGPCRMMAPIFKKVAGELVDKAVFVKVDTNQQYELSSRFQVRSLPTFMWFVGDTKGPIQVEKGGIGEGPLRQYTQKAMRQAENENVVLEWESFLSYYEEMDPSKSVEDLEQLYQKCAKKIKGSKGQCVGSSASALVRKLKKKYRTAPPTIKRFVPGESSTKSSEGAKEKKEDGALAEEARKLADQESKLNIVLSQIEKHATGESLHPGLGRLQSTLRAGDKLVGKILSGGWTNYSYKIYLENQPNCRLFAKVCFPRALWDPSEESTYYDLERQTTEFRMMEHFTKHNLISPTQ